MQDKEQIQTLIKEKSNLQESCLVDKERITQLQVQLADLTVENKNLHQLQRVTQRAKPVEKDMGNVNRSQNNTAADK